VERFHRTYGQECLQIYQPGTLQEVREVTEAFLQHDNWERPHQGRACGNVPPRVAFPTLPALPALPQRVDPDAWLASLDQKMYLRRVGRDGCVNIDLTTYYIGPETGWADCPVGRVRAEHRQFAVWSQDQVVKLLPVPRLDWPAHEPGRLSAVHQARGVGGPATFFGPGVQESPTAFSVGRRSLISSFIRWLSQALASPAGKWREHVVSGQAKTLGNEEEICWKDTPLRLTACSTSSRTSFCLFRLSFSLFNLYYFDVATQPAGTMTGSRTRCASRGQIGKVSRYGPQT
jgi:Integrase core domain